MVRAVDKADAVLTLSRLYNIGSHLPFTIFILTRSGTGRFIAVPTNLRNVNRARAEGHLSAGND